MPKLIIKTLSRKRPSFFQLHDYMQTGAEDKEEIISRNMTHTQNRTQVLNQFSKNYTLLKQIKGANSMYHDILSLEHNAEIPIQRQKEIMKSLAQKYLELRAEHNIAIGYIHTETNNIHCHLMISSNPKHEPNRLRHSKEDFSKIQKELENYKIEQFPELGNEKLYTRERTKQKTYQNAQAKDREAYLKHRTKESSRKDQIRQIIAECISDSYSQEQLIKKLAKHNLEFYQRGETAGIIDLQKQSKGETKCKHRLKTLGVESEYWNLMEFEKSREKEIEKIRWVQERDVEDEIER
jgi:hypothetical protein